MHTLYEYLYYSGVLLVSGHLQNHSRSRKGEVPRTIETEWGS